MNDYLLDTNNLNTCSRRIAKSKGLGGDLAIPAEQVWDKSLKRMILALILAIVALSALSCGDDGLIDPHGEADFPSIRTDGLHANDFPTYNGSAWTYVNPATNQEFTVRIEGTRDIEGFTHRQMTISDIRPGPPDRIILAPVDQLSANALYFRFNSDDFLGGAFPLVATYFLKTPDAYTESAFDAFVGLPDNPVFHEKHFPARRIWDFPLQVGKAWVVFEKTTVPGTRVVRRVVAANVPVTIPAGRYTAYVVEEEIVGFSKEVAFRQVGDTPQLEPAQYEPAKYWVVPDVGVAKYQYTVLIPMRNTEQESFILLESTTFELKRLNLSVPVAPE